MSHFLIFLPHPLSTLEFLISLQQIGYKCSFGNLQLHFLGPLQKGRIFTSNTNSGLVEKRGFWGYIRAGDITQCFCADVLWTVLACVMKVLVLLTDYRSASSIYSTDMDCCIYLLLLGIFASHLNDSTYQSWKKRA